MEQNYKNHTRLVTGYHKVLGLLLIAGFIGSLINLYEKLSTNDVYAASLVTLLFLCAIMIAWYSRVFALKAQDRAIRSEENFRHYILTGKPLPAGLQIAQIVALRFASDEEFISLATDASNKNLSSKDIKLAVKSWKADHHRV